MRVFKKNDPKVIKAWTFYDWANSVYNLIISTAIFPIFYQTVTKNHASQNGLVREINGESVDMVKFFGREFINTELYSYVYSLSFLLVVIMVPILSGIADYSGTKKRFMQFFCYLGAAGCISLYFFDVNHLEMSMLPLFFASIGFWGSLVFYNSFLLEIADKDQHDQISARGFALGYIGSVLLLITILLLTQVLQVMPVRYAFALVGVWWIGFAHDEIGAIKFMGYDGANYINGASIRARIDNDPSIGTDMPTRLEFLTTPDNDATPQIRMTIKETGNVGINFETPNSTLHVEGSFSTAIRIAPTSNPPVNPSGPATPADVTIGKNDHTVVFNPSTVGYNSVTLPNASSCGGRIYYLLNRSGFTI